MSTNMRQQDEGVIVSYSPDKGTHQLISNSSIAEDLSDFTKIKFIAHDFSYMHTAQFDNSSIVEAANSDARLYHLYPNIKLVYVSTNVNLARGYLNQYLAYLEFCIKENAWEAIAMDDLAHVVEWVRASEFDNVTL